MRKRLIGCLTGLLLSATGLPLTAQTWEFGVAGGASRISSALLGSLSFDDPKSDDSRLRGKNMVGGRVTLNTRGYYGHELGYMRNAARFQTKVVENNARVARESSVQAHHLFYNFLAYFMPAGERWRPFITGGAQLQEFTRPKLDNFPIGGTRKYGVNWGGGIKFLLMKNALVRLDFRDYISGKPYLLSFPTPTGFGVKSDESGLLHTYEASIGFSVAF